MSKKVFSPGETVEESGIYPVVGPDGEAKGYEVTVVEGEPFPPTPEKGWGFGSPQHLAKRMSDDQENSAELPSPDAQENLALVPSAHLPNDRPVLASSREVASLDHLPLHRPVFRSNLDIVAMHGNRPVVRINSHLVPSSSLPGNRPIAANEDLPDSNLMGFLD